MKGGCWDPSIVIWPLLTPTCASQSKWGPMTKSFRKQVLLKEGRVCCSGHTLVGTRAFHK